MVKNLLIMLALMMPVGAGLLSATGRVPLRPADGIYDEGGWLQGDDRVEMVRRILGAREKGDSAVFVVILDEDPEEVDLVAARLGREWGKGGLWGMVLHAKGEPGFPKFYAELSRLPGWSEEQRTEFEGSVKRALEKVSQSAASVSGEHQKVAAGAREMADELGYLGLVMARIDHSNSQARGDRVEEVAKDEKGDRKGLWWMIGVPALVLLVAVLIYLIFKEEEVEEEGYLFPETEARRRFRAPWSGGGNVLLEFRRSKGDR